jgi:hypothetical protein
MIPNSNPTLPRRARGSGKRTARSHRFPRFDSAGRADENGRPRRVGAEVPPFMSVSPDHSSVRVQRALKASRWRRLTLSQVEITVADHGGTMNRSSSSSARRRTAAALAFASLVAVGAGAASQAHASTPSSSSHPANYRMELDGRQVAATDLAAEARFDPRSRIPPGTCASPATSPPGPTATSGSPPAATRWGASRPTAS